MKEEQMVSDTGAKRNTVGKIPYQYLPLDLLDGASYVMEMGAAKYGNQNFRLNFNPLDCFGSLIRHVATLKQAVEQDDIDGSKGFLLDSESGKSHVHHVITSTLILIQSMRAKGWKV